MDSFIKLSNFGKIAPYAQLFRQGLLVTVLLSLFTVAIGFVLALILALMRMSNIRPFRALAVDRNGHLREGGPLVWLSKFNPLSFIATAYVEILRSTPVLVQIFIIYYGVFGMIDLPSFQLFGFIKFNRFFPGVVALGMNSGAYLCEIMRAGIQSIDQGQTEAARSLGLSQTMNLRLHHPSAGTQEYPSGDRKRIRCYHQGIRDHIHHRCTGYHVCRKRSQRCDIHYHRAVAGSYSYLLLPVLPNLQTDCIFRKENEPWRQAIV